MQGNAKAKPSAAAPPTAHSASESASAAPVSESANYWDLPHPGVAPEWAADSDKLNQASPDTIQPAPVDASSKPDQAAADTVSDKEESAGTGVVHVTVAAAEAVSDKEESADAVDVHVAVADQQSSPVDTVTQADKHGVNSGSSGTLIEVQSDADKAVHTIPVQVYSADAGTEGRDAVKSKGSAQSAVNRLMQNDTDSSNSNGGDAHEVHNNDIPVEVTVADGNKSNSETVSQSGSTGAAVNWLIQPEGTSAYEGSIPVHVHKDLL